MLYVHIISDIFKEKKMKKTAVSVFLCIAVMLTAVACGSQSGPTNLDIKAAAAAVIKSGAYTDTMSETGDASTAISLYKLDAADVADSDVYFSSMATAEECAIFKAASKDAAARILTACKDRQASQVTAYQNYVPTEVAKINAAIITQAGDYVFYIVSNDQTKVASVLSQYGVTVDAGK